MNPGYRYGQQIYAPTQSQAAALLSKVSYLLCTCLLVTGGAAYVARDMWGLMWPCAIGTFICVLALGFARRVTGVNLVLLYLLAVLEGGFLGPCLNAYAHASAAGGTLITQAFVLTATIVGGIGAYIYTTNSDFGFLGKFLSWALIGLLVVMLITMFTRWSLPGFDLFYCIAGVAIFVGFTLYDFSNIKLRYGPNDYVMATVQLYLDFLNLFMFLLQLLGMLQGGGGRSRN